MSTNKQMTMGLIVGNRGFFPGHLAESGRKEMICTLKSAGIDVIALTPEQGRYGAVETHEEAKRCAELFRAHSEQIDGV
ncbi:MAG: fucose isomerase, partial [Candidatus Acidiferrales bacterium]